VVNLSICPCGFPCLNENVQIGHKYTVYPLTVEPATYICGSCRRSFSIFSILCGPDFPPKPLPLGMFTHPVTQ
jgi:hypothetical protein